MSDREAPLDWREWMRDLGVQQRRIRQFLGLSQDELARRAAVSQAAVSRLETGRGLATPLLIVLRIGQALVRELRQLDPAILNSRLRGAVETPDLVPGVVFGQPPDPDPSEDERGADELVEIYRGLPEAKRPDFLVFLQSAASALGEAGGVPKTALPRRRRSAG
jgi:transcriptional regulator with XRE-family HTH domain